MPVWLNSVFIDYADTGFAKWHCESKRSRLALDPLKLQHTNKSVRTVHQKTMTTFKPKRRGMWSLFSNCVHYVFCRDLPFRGLQYSRITFTGTLVYNNNF